MARAFIPHLITSDSAAGGQIIDGSQIFNGEIEGGRLTRTPSSLGNRKSQDKKVNIIFNNVSIVMVRSNLVLK